MGLGKSFKKAVKKVTKSVSKVAKTVGNAVTGGDGAPIELKKKRLLGT